MDPKPLLSEDWYKEGKLPFFLPGDVTFQWKLLPDEYQATHRMLLTWLALAKYWHYVQSDTKFSVKDYHAVQEKVEELEREDPSMIQPTLSPWNRHGNNLWHYLPCSYPLTIQECFATLQPKPRFPWRERIGAWKGNKIPAPPVKPPPEMQVVKKVRGLAIPVVQEL